MLHKLRCRMLTYAAVCWLVLTGVASAQCLFHIHVSICTCVPVKQVNCTPGKEPQVYACVVCLEREVSRERGIRFGFAPYASWHACSRRQIG